MSVFVLHKVIICVVLISEALFMSGMRGHAGVW